MPKNPHADFSPVLDGYSGIGAFRFWCQTALPLTYDDSLSYYELLNKVVNYLNHTINDLTAVENNTSALAEAYNQLQKYVNDYFDDLDIEAELRNVLDAMAEDGTLDALLDPIVENQLPGVVEEKIDGVVAEQIDGAVAGQIDESVADQLPALVDAGIPGEVSDWLDENVDPVGSAVVVDSSLTISGAAADAKVTGDELSDLKTQLDNVVVDVRSIVYKWVEGYRLQTDVDTVNPNGATANSSYAYIIIPCEKGVKYKITTTANPTYRGCVITDSSYNVQVYLGNTFTNHVFTATENGYIICNTQDRTADHSLSRIETYSELKEQFDYLGIYDYIDFSVTAGTGHASTADQLNISIKSGAGFYVLVSGSIDRWNIVAYYDDGTSETLIGDADYYGIAAKNIYAFGISASNSWISQSGTVRVQAYTANSVYDRISRIENTIIPLGKYYTETFDVTAGTSHSSTADKMPVNILTGQGFSAYVVSTVPRYQIYAYYSDGTNEKIATDAPYTGIASKDIAALSVYILGDWITTDTTVTIKTYTTKSVYERLENLEIREDAVEKEIGQVGYCYTKNINAIASTAHSSALDRMPVNFKNGEEFYVFVSGGITRYQIYLVYSDTTSEKVTQDYPFYGSASKDVSYIGIYWDAAWVPADTVVSIKAFYADSLYGKTANIPGVKTVETTVLGADLPDNLADYGITQGYATAMQNAIDAWMSYYAGDDKIIPFIVHTDQHGTLTLANKDIFRMIDYLVNWDGVSAIFNLGDTVEDHWETDYASLRCETLETALKCLENIPKNKRIDVFGNHDTWYDTGEVRWDEELGKYVKIVTNLPSMKYNNPYFLSDGLITRKVADNSGLKVVYDTKRNVKYLILAGWDYSYNGVATSDKYQYYWINQDHLEWIVKEMEKNDGYDLILVSHVPLEMGATGCVDPITGTSIERAEPVYITHLNNFLVPLWNARKNKTSGAVSSNGVSVSYNFTNCENDCYCALSGHTHWDGIQYLNNANDGLLNVAFDFFKEGQTVHFGVIDRGERKIKVWKLSNDSNTPAVTAWEKDLDKVTTP